MRHTLLAVGVHVLILVLVLIPPLWVRATGTAVYLETEKMDPRALFRGHYVILGYTLAQGIVDPPDDAVPGTGDNAVYVTITTDRPARFVAVGDERPDLAPGQACIVGRKRGFAGAVDFPQIAQFFAARDEAVRLEARVGAQLLAEARTDRRCNAVLVGLVPG